VTVADLDRLPLAPLIVNVYEPTDVAFVVETFSVDVPEPLIEVGVNVAVAAFGSPATLKLTVPLFAPIVTV
jgi:hypothetical protein